jgi:peptide/nickel transport system ATP-binding protein
MEAARRQLRFVYGDFAFMTLFPPGGQSPTDAVLSVRNLQVGFPGVRGTVRAVDGVTFDIAQGELVAVVGESGSGKTVLASSVLRLLDESKARISGDILLQGRDIRPLSDRQMSDLRGRVVSIIFQDPLSALNPLMTIGRQVRESLLVHRLANRSSADQAALDLLKKVEMPDPAGQFNQYPHQLSGGMNQRAMIAIALACNPALLVADEPTTALDATTQLQIMDLIRGLARERRMAVLMVTHDLGLVSEFADRVLIMYAGKLMEDAPKDKFVNNPANPYSRALNAATPRGDRALRVIQGSIPNLAELPPGCVFEPRCELGSGRVECQSSMPELVALPGQPGRRSACHFPGERSPEVSYAARPATTVRSGRDTTEPVLMIDRLTKDYEVQGRFLHKGHTLRAVDTVSIDVHAGETVALVGESGSGKSTMARVALRLLEPTSGSISFEGKDITHTRGAELREIRSRLGLIFQDPDSSLNPLITAEQTVSEPLRVHKFGDAEAIQKRVVELFASVNIDPERRHRYPREFSGGERQRLAIARALAMNPALIVCDEPTTMLDVSVQAQILALLKRIQNESSVAFLFIAHDLEVVRQISHRVAVMYAGRVLELCSTEKLFAHAEHPYSRALLSASTSAEREGGDLAARLVLRPPDRTGGCPYAPTCWKAQELCSAETPILAVAGTDEEHRVACHFPETASPAAVASAGKR